MGFASSLVPRMAKANDYSTGLKERLLNREVKHFGMDWNEDFEDCIKEMELGETSAFEMCSFSLGQTVKSTIGNRKPVIEFIKLGSFSVWVERDELKYLKEKIWRWSNIKTCLGSRNSWDKYLACSKRSFKWVDCWGTVTAWSLLIEQAVVLVTLM